MKTLRPSHGSALLWTIFATMAMLLVLAVGFTFYGMFFAERRLADQTEEAALLSSRLLNGGDQEGQINNITAASRQLVFDSRQTYNDIVANHAEVLPLAQQLLDESRAGAKIVTTEREHILSLTLANLRDWARTVNGQESKNEFVLPWAHTVTMSVERLDVGYFTGMDSNVRAPQGNPGLMANDKKYIDPDTNLYYGNISLPLQGPDSDLDFKLSSLPAPVKGTVPPMRLASNAVFAPTRALVKDGQPELGSCEQIPSALQLTTREDFHNSLAVKTANTIFVCKTAITTGASPMP